MYELHNNNYPGTRQVAKNYPGSLLPGYLAGTWVPAAALMMMMTMMMMVMTCLFDLAASRAKMVAMKGVSKLRGTQGTLLYPQPEGLLGECMSKYGRELGDESLLGTSSDV